MGSIDVGSLLAETYEVTRLIGRGGMGEVWLAKHRRLPGKQVAVKVLHLNGKELSADALTRFRREAEVATRINHPNIVEVHDFNTLPDGAPYLVLEFLQGESLTSRLRHPIELDEVQKILRQVGSALQAAHLHGVIHRDLKPDNIFLVAEPMGTVVKVLDFGISKLVDSGTLQTQEAVLVGTPAYMSPEQALGNNKDVGPPSDVFALGAIAYEMLTGAVPFAAESVAQLLFKIAYEPHRPLASLREGLPPNVVQAVERALLKDRTARYPEMGSFIEQLTGAPLPAALRRPEEQDQPSGVATPGARASDSVMMGKTAASTPAAAGGLASPWAANPLGVGPVTPAVAPVVRAGPGRLLLVALAVLLAAGAVGVWLGPLAKTPEAIRVVAPAARPVVVKEARAALRPRVVALPPEVSVDAGGAPSLVGQLAPAVDVDAGAAPRLLVLEPTVALDAGPLPVAAPVVAVDVLDAGGALPPVRRVEQPPAEELARLDELDQLVRAKRFQEAVEIVDRVNRLQLSQIGLSYAAMLSTQAHCGHKDQAPAQSRYRGITEPSHRVAAKSFCAKYIDVSLLTR